MIQGIVGLLSHQNLIEIAQKEFFKMTSLAHHIFESSKNALRDLPSEDVSTGIYELDKKINHLERSIRRKIYTHLSLNIKKDINLGLNLVAIVHDVERIGDFGKNIYELSQKFEGPMHFGPFEGTVSSIEDSILKVFEVMNKEQGMVSESTISQLLSDLTIANRNSDGLINAYIDEGQNLELSHSIYAGHLLYFRYLKRISSHLRNIGSSFVNPFDRIGFSHMD